MKKLSLTAVAALVLSLGVAGEYARLPVFSEAYAQAATAASLLTEPQLQALVAPIALYPDSLLSQMLMASTYPLEIAEATSWLQANPNVKGDALQTALGPQKWDNSVKSLVSFPEALNVLGNKLDWAQKIGDAYLAQPKDVMQAIQALRAKARSAGHLNSTSQLTVSTTPESNILIVPASPQVIYVPTYNPTVVYGPWPYPAFPPYPGWGYGYGYGVGWGPGGYAPGATAAMGLMSFGAGMAVGAALWSSPNWSHGSITINNTNFNNFNRNFNNVNNRAGSNFSHEGNWNYNPDHRGNVPYSNSGLQNKYGGGQSEARQNAQREASRTESADSARNVHHDETRAHDDYENQSQNAKNRESSDFNKMSSENQERAKNADAKAKSNYQDYDSEHSGADRGSRKRSSEGGEHGEESGHRGR